MKNLDSAYFSHVCAAGDIGNIASGVFSGFASAALPFPIGITVANLYKDDVKEAVDLACSAPPEYIITFVSEYLYSLNGALR